MDAQVGFVNKGVEESVAVFGLTAAVGADDAAGDETINVGDTAVLMLLLFLMYVLFLMILLLMSTPVEVAI